MDDEERLRFRQLGGGCTADVRAIYRGTASVGEPQDSDGTTPITEPDGRSCLARACQRKRKGACVLPRSGANLGVANGHAGPSGNRGRSAPSPSGRHIVGICKWAAAAAAPSICRALCGGLGPALGFHQALPSPAHPTTITGSSCPAPEAVKEKNKAKQQLTEPAAKSTTVSTTNLDVPPCITYRP